MSLAVSNLLLGYTVFNDKVLDGCIDMPANLSHDLLVLVF